MIPPNCMPQTVLMNIVRPFCCAQSKHKNTRYKYTKGRLCIHPDTIRFKIILPENCNIVTLLDPDNSLHLIIF